MMKTIMAHQHSDAPALVQDSNDINVVFQKMVAKNPSARYQSMADVISAFESVVEQSDEITETSDDSQKSNPSTSTLLDTNRVTESNPALQRPRHRWPLLAACSIAFAGLVLAYGTFLRVRTSEGIITLVIDQPELTGAIVSVDGEKKITITTGEGKEPIEVVADKNTHTLKVTKGGFETFTKQFTLNAGGEKTIRVHLEPAKLAKNTTPSTEAPSVNSAVGADDSAIQAVQQAGNFAWPTDQPAAAIGPYNGKQAERFQQQWAKHLGVEVEATNTLGMKFRVIPAAEFVMGSSEEEIKKLMKETEKLPDDYYKRIPDEGPQHNVVLTKPFAFAIHEVTRGQFRQFVDSTNYTTDAERDGTGGHGYKGKQWISAPEFHWDMNPGFETAQTDDHPVLNVSWNDAVAFCIWLSKKEGLTYRLPTEAEWEFACRAGSSGQFSPNGDGSRLSEYAWHAIEGGASTKPVGTKRANALGLHDLHGHVWEWCADNYGLYKSSPVTDPQGSANEASRVLRGGGFTNHAMLVRTTNRKLQPPTYRSCNIGFRPVREFKPSP